MSLDISVILELLVLGIGGGMVLVPFLTHIMSARGASPDLAVKMAIATAMATIVFTSVSSVRAHHARGHVRWDIVKRLVPGILLGGLLASLGVFSLLKGAGLALIFGLFVLFSATQMLLDKKPAPSRHMPGAAGQLAAGGVIGFVSGLLGAGGGFISVPFMIWCNVTMVQAVATSAALGFPIAAVNTLGFAIGGQSVSDLPPFSLGYIWLPALAFIAVASVFFAPVGAYTAQKIDVKRLKRIFAVLLYSLACTMLHQAWQGLFGNT
jgi:uncharacterized protein